MTQFGLRLSSTSQKFVTLGKCELNWSSVWAQFELSLSSSSIAKMATAPDEKEARTYSNLHSGLRLDIQGKWGIPDLRQKTKHLPENPFRDEIGTFQFDLTLECSLSSL